jgi:hypothetical protein
VILAIDPGTTHSGLVVLQDGNPRESVIVPNAEVLDWIRDWRCPVAIEMIASYGMAVGAEVFQTCLWIGRFLQVAGEERTTLVHRRTVKMHLCGSAKAKDQNIRQALIDRWGGKAEAVGTSKKRGPLYGVKSHAWAALAVAVTVADGAAA